MRRFIARLSPLAALALCVPAHAIVRYADGDPTSHTTAPTGTFANAGWQYEGQFGDPANAGNAYVGTPIGPHAFITAAHVGGYIGSAFTYNRQTHTVTCRAGVAEHRLAFAHGDPKPSLPAPGY